MRGETDVTANYRFAESVDGKLTVTARKVVMTSADDEKVYDGTPLTNDEITVTGDGFIEGEGVTYDVTGSQLDVGSSDNSFTYELNEGTLAENYIIETEEGKLTVTSPEQLEAMSGWDKEGAWVADYDFIDSLLAEQTPGLTNEDIQDNIYAMDYDAIKARLG